MGTPFYVMRRITPGRFYSRKFSSNGNVPFVISKSESGVFYLNFPRCIPPMGEGPASRSLPYLSDGEQTKMQLAVLCVLIVKRHFPPKPLVKDYQQQLVERLSSTVRILP